MELMQKEYLLWHMVLQHIQRVMELLLIIILLMQKVFIQLHLFGHLMPKVIFLEPLVIIHMQRVLILAPKVLLLMPRGKKQLHRAMFPMRKESKH